MKVILQETLEGVGDLGDLLDVSNGFARNYLLPRKKAVEANSRNIKEFEHATDRLRERTGREAEQDIEVVREEIVQEYLQGVRIVERHTDEEAKTCSATAVMARPRLSAPASSESNGRESAAHR